MVCITKLIQAQEYFTVPLYKVVVHLNKDASLDIDETIHVHFTEQRHGIYRSIPYRYTIEQLPAGTEKAHRQMESGGYAKVIVENIKVDGWNYEVTKDDAYKYIRMGSENTLVDGDQQYVIHYRMLNAINFFKDHSELYYNIIGDLWNTTIDSVNFTVQLYDALPGTPDYFVATGQTGSKENNTHSSWTDNKTFTGSTTAKLPPYNGVTVGIVLPKDFITEQNYNLLGIKWMLLPIAVFFSMFSIWKRWGKDDKPTIQTEFYPPAGVSPSVCGYIIDDRLNRRDLTALVPYWGAHGYLQVKETETDSLWGLIKNTDYIFIKLKDLPEEAETFEKLMFYGIFYSGDQVTLSGLKDVLYKSMDSAINELQTKVTREQYYVKGSVANVVISIFIGIACLVYGGGIIIGKWEGYLLTGIAWVLSGIIIGLFGWFMRKKTEKGTELLQKLLGFKEFLKSVEKDRLREFLKQDKNYFDKILPFAIVFGIADTWQDKLEGLDIPPPKWYSGNYTGFNTAMFMSSLNSSLNQMSDTFYSSPKSSGSSGGSFGGGGFSGGGFGGGGGGSW